MKERGYTLVELLISVTLLALIAVVAIPDPRPAGQERLTLAASLAADAFRFARDEATRTGDIYGVYADIPNNRIDVFRLDQAPDPDVAVFDVRHPVSKQLYRVQLGSGPVRGVLIQSRNGTPTAACNDTSLVGIDPSGATICVDPVTTRIENVSLTLAHDGTAASVAVDSYTARTTVQ